MINKENFASRLLKLGFIRVNKNRFTLGNIQASWDTEKNKWLNLWIEPSESFVSIDPWISTVENTNELIKEINFLKNNP
jgi:hypothetical protein